jgi:hypothetical protein
MSQSEATGPRSPATAHSLRLTQRLSQVESVPPRLPAQPTRCRVTLPPCETDGSSGRSNPQASKNQITVPNSGSWGPFATQPTTLAANSAGAHRRRRHLASPATTAISISRRIRQNRGNHPISLELPISATTQRPRDFRLQPQSQRIALSSVPPRGTQHIQAPIPLAQASVRSPLTLQKERTRKLQVHMGLAASTTARISSSNR